MDNNVLNKAIKIQQTFNLKMAELHKQTISSSKEYRKLKEKRPFLFKTKYSSFIPVPAIYSQSNFETPFIQQDLNQLSLETLTEFQSIDDTDSDMSDTNFEDVQPVKEIVQLPIKLYKIYKGKRIEAVLYYMDSEQGWHSIINPEGDHNMKSFACLEILWPHNLNEPCLYSTPTRALKEWQKNTENGWAALKNAENDKPLRLHRVIFGGGGFKNPPFATTLHRDLLAMFCTDKLVTKYYHDKSMLQEAKKKIKVNDILNFLCQDKPHVRSRPPGLLLQNFTS